MLFLKLNNKRIEGSNPFPKRDGRVGHMLNKNQHNIKGELKIQVARNRKAVMWILDICSSYHCPDMAPKCVSTRATKIVLKS